MTDKKFTDEEITKGLECCIAFDCRNCPLGSKCNSSPPSLLPFKCALDLINRQKAEIESLKIEFSAMRDMANLYKAKNEKLRAKVETRTQEKLALGRVYTQKLKTAKSEARKEFAKKITDILLKEMIGGE